MAFKRKETTIEATDLNTISPEEAEKRIIAGVKKYATNEANFAKADANTPYLGHIIGMGIESSNLADITMSIERQFLTKMTTRVEGADKLSAGELGKLRILDGQDALAATPGLSVKMLMDLGHMPQNAGYLEKVVSFAYINALGDGWRLNDALKKTLGKAEKLSGGERDEAVANVKTLVGQAKDYDAKLADPAALAASRQKAYENDKAAVDALTRDLGVISDKVKGLSSGADSGELSKLRTEEAEVKTRLKMAQAKLRVSKETAEQAGNRRPVEDAKVKELRAAIAETLASSSKLVG